MGLSRAGFEVVGVDIEDHPNYPFEFHRADALTFPLDGFDLIWASPPCQRYSVYSRNLGTSERHPDLVAPIRERLLASRTPYIIENVVGAPLKTTVMLCGSMFGLAVRRHRNFECSFPITFAPAACNHAGFAIPVYGNGTPEWHRKRYPGSSNRAPNSRRSVDVSAVRGIPIAVKRAAMGIDWTNRYELSQAIPPAYSEWLARRFLETRKAAA